MESAPVRAAPPGRVAQPGDHGGPKLLWRQQRRNQRGLEGICKATAACGLPLCIVKRYRFYSAKRWTSFSLAPYTGIGSLTRSCRRTPIGIKGTGPAPWRHCDSGLVSAVGRRP